MAPLTPRLAEARLGAEPGLAPKGAPRRLGPDSDLVPRGAAVPARRRPDRRCFLTCGFSRTSDGQVFSYRGFEQLPQLAESTS